MTFLTERLAELRKYVQHLRAIRPRVESSATLRADLTLHNDVVFSLLQVAQLVIDVSGELAARNGIRFETYTEAIRALEHIPGFPAGLVETLARLPGFRNIVMHDYLQLDYELVLSAIDDLSPVEDFIRLVARLEAAE